MEQRKPVGAHYTPAILADFLAGEIISSLRDSDKSKMLRVLDPAVGDGELLKSILNQLSANGYVNVEVTGFDTDKNAALYASERLRALFPAVSQKYFNENFLDFVQTNNGNDLFNTVNIEPFDVIIANPPYVRTQVMGAKLAQKLARQFHLSGRVDLYYAFIAGMAEVLKTGGIIGVIVSNRFMKTRSGNSVRKSMTEIFDIIHVWDFGDTQLFEAAVLPAVILAKRRNHALPSEMRAAKFSTIYSTDDISEDYRCNNVIEALAVTGIVRLANDQCYHVQHGNLDFGTNSGDVWRLNVKGTDDWLRKVRENTYCTFGDIGKIRVGVKTTADDVFINPDWDDMDREEQPELLKPLITHHIARRYKAMDTTPQKKILYPHVTENGKRKTVDLEKYPKTAAYLNRYRSILEKRDYVMKSGRQWFEIWVPHHPHMWAQPKIVFRDISKNATCWLDTSGAIVNGDCYWLTCNQASVADILWLALAVGNSSFVETFYDHKFNNKLYSGRRRFLTQYVEQFPLPDPARALSKEIVSKTKKIYSITPSPEGDDLAEEIDRLVGEAFGVANQKNR
ncbi:MAG: N-6 DNA methylase [Syntrophales bacterium]|nr:N-6 DNA methylase [Syntrophales bacterium]MDP3096315.1 N-6 DNA methylase [Syntrophales bacterium]